MKISVFLYGIVFVCMMSCTNETDKWQPEKKNSQEIEGWTKAYPSQQIVELKKYVRAIDNRLVLTIDRNFAESVLHVSGTAYADLQANLADVNKVLATAEEDSCEIKLEYPFLPTRSEEGGNYCIFTRPAHAVIKITPWSAGPGDGGGPEGRDTIRPIERDTISPPGPQILARMEANSNCAFLSGDAHIVSKTTINTSVFFWTFRIFDDIWGEQKGTSGVGVLGENGSVVSYQWLCCLDFGTGQFNWEFHNVSSATDGVSISHFFEGQPFNPSGGFQN